MIDIIYIPILFMFKSIENTELSSYIRLNFVEISGWILMPLNSHHWAHFSEFLFSHDSLQIHFLHFFSKVLKLTDTIQPMFVVFENLIVLFLLIAHCFLFFLILIQE